MQAQDDLEHGSSPPSQSVRGLAIQEVTSSPQPMYFSDPANEEKLPEGEDDVFGGAQSTGQVIDGLPRRGTSQSSYGDPSAKIWGLYLSRAKKLDKEHSESWTRSLDGLLVFTGLFFATVAGFLVVSYPLLQPAPADLTNHLLSQISQQLLDFSNGTPPSAPLSFDNPPPFKLPAYALRVNVLWFTSLATSTACALWATLMQQWTRRYVQVADGPYNPQKRVWVREFFAEGVDNFGLAAAVEVLPALLHAAVLMFYIGLVDFLFNINHVVAYFLIACISMAVLIYSALTIMPLLYHNSPYQTPLTSVVWFIIKAAPLLKLWLRRQTGAIPERRKKIWEGMRVALETTAIKFELQAYFRALRWTLRTLDEDHELEEFLGGLPGLFNVSTGRYPPELKGKLDDLVYPVTGRLFATCKTGLLPEATQRQRLTACLGAVWCFPNTADRHFRAIWDQWAQPTNDPWGPLSTETWAMAATMTDADPSTAIRAHCIQALIAAMWRNGRWECPRREASSLLQQQLGAPSVDIERWSQREGHMKLALAANLLSNVLPLVPQLEGGSDMSLKIDIKSVLDMICRDQDTSDVPDDLKARFVDSAEVTRVFNIGVDVPWSTIFTPVDSQLGY